MSTELIINGSLPETRIALTENGEIQELLIERASGKGIVGNIYKGRVTRVLPGMQAAFVDIGLEKAAFLYVDDVFVHSEVWEEEEAASEDAESLPVLTGGEHAVAAEQVAEAATESEAQTVLQQACEPARGLEGVDVLGPAPAVIGKVKDRWRWHMLAKCYTADAFARAMQALGTVEDRATRTCRVTLDVDPGSLM